MKKVSVVIPTHNRSELLKRSIESALNQDYKLHEIIVVSDGSTDDTDEMMKSNFENNPLVHYFSYSPNKGGNYARNFGIKESTGDYVAFLDDDDEWHSDKIKKQVEMIEKDKEIGLVCTAVNNIHVGGKEKHIFIPPAKYDSSKEIMLKNCIGSTTTVMVKKELFDKVGMFDESLPALQDYDMWFRLCQVTKVGVVETPCVEYYNYENSNQISNNTKKYIDAENAISKKYKEELSKLSSKEIKQRKSYFQMLISKKGMRNGQIGIAIKYGFKSFIAHPSKSSLICFLASFVPYKITLKIRKLIFKKGLN